MPSSVFRILFIPAQRAARFEQMEKQTNASIYFSIQFKR